MTHHDAESASCRELFARLSEYIDGELDASLCSGVETHMGDCAPCRDFLESLRRTVRLVESIPRAGLDEAAREELRRACDRFRGREDA